MPETLDRLLSSVPVGDPPLDSLVSQGRLARRRRRRLITGAVAGVTALVVVGAALLAQAVGLGDQPPPPADTPSGVVPTPPDGMKYVGLGKVAVAVPEGWAYSDARCDGTNDTYRRAMVTRKELKKCPPARGPEREFGSTVALRLGTAAPGRDSAVVERRIVSGHEVVDHGGGCIEYNPGECFSSIWIPSLRVVIELNLSGTDGGWDAIRQIQKSLIILSDGVVAVPLPRQADPAAEFETAVVDEGLVPAPTYLDCPPTDDCDAGIHGLDPDPGALVAEGATVSYRTYDPPLAAAEPGRQRVGLDGVTVEVPDTWVERDGCGDTPTGTTYGPPTTADRDCVMTDPSDGTLVRFEPTAGDLSADTDGVEVRQVDGTEVYLSPVVCFSGLPGCARVVSVPERDVSLGVRVGSLEQSRREIRRILDTLAVES